VARAVPGIVYTTKVCAPPGLVYCITQGPELHQDVSTQLQELLKMKLSSKKIAVLGMEKASCWCRNIFSLVQTYITSCWKYLPVSGARPSSRCFR